MVCAPDRLAAEAGVATLRVGGSAADAAVAASAVLAVTFQHACGMGGDLFALVHDGREVSCVNASGRAGSGADAGALRGSGLAEIPLRDHIAAVTIPGCVDGWLALHDRHGVMPIADVLAPAIDYARNGFPASPSLAMAVPAIVDRPGADDYRAVAPVRPGTVIRRPLVADTLASIAGSGRNAFYQGAFGRGLIALGGGLFAAGDLERPQADWPPPLAVNAFGRRIWTAGPNSQGYLTLAAAWIASGLDIPRDADDPAWAHLLIEASRQASYDRPDILSDHADGVALVAPERLAPRRAAIDQRRAATLGAESHRGGGTISLCAVDSERRGVVLVQSNAAGWGSYLIEPATRIFLQNRGIGFSLIPGHPAEYAPHRRPPHTLAPALVTARDDALAAVLGTMGGDSQPQIIVQLLSRWLGCGQDPGDAVAAGRWVLSSVAPGSGFTTWDAAGRVAVDVESHAPARWDAGLDRRGHIVRRHPPMAGGFGWAQFIAVDGDQLAGGSDPRPGSGGIACW
jgi:gamma-glutamyltranspeptidase/glutathione hydrolase